MLQLPSLVNYLSCPSSFYALSYLDYNTLLRQYEKMEGNPLALFLKKTTHIPNLMVSQFCLNSHLPLGDLSLTIFASPEKGVSSHHWYWSPLS